MKGRLDIVLESTSLPTTKRLVAAGDLFAIMTWSSVVEEVQQGTLRAAKITNPELPRQLFLCRVRDRRHSSAVQAVVNATREIVTEAIRDGIFS